MKKIIIALGILLLCFRGFGQQYNYYINGFLQQPNAAAARNYLQITNGGSGGSGGVTNFSSGGLSFLFNSSVANPTHFPSLSFSPIPQIRNTVFAGPTSGANANPTFRALTLDDLPTLPSGGSVTNFHAGDFSPLFTSTVSDPTTNPSLSFNSISQSPNTFYGGPSSGGSASPTFRGLTSSDIPDLSGTYLPLTGGTLSGTLVTPELDSALVMTDVLRGNTGDTVKLNGPLLINDAAANGQIQDSSGHTLIDPLGNFFGNGSGMTGVILSITNASTLAGDQTLISKSNTPIASLKALTQGTGITLSSTSTNVTISAAAASGVSGIDIWQTNMPPFDGKTNWYLDFSYAAQVFNPTGAIFFNYATNWGLANTSRVVTVYIPPTNYFRPVYFIGSATNWHQQVRSISAIPTGYGARINFQVFGQLDTNVCYTPFIDNNVTGTNWLTVNGFNPTNSQGGCVFWLEASSKQVFQDEFGTIPSDDGLIVRAATDLSKTFGRATNASTTTFLFYRSPNSSVGNIPALNFTQGGPAWLVTSNFSADLPQTNWAFMMFYGRGTSLVFLDGLSEGHRFACNPSESPLVSCLLYSGTSLTYTPPNALKWQLFAFQQSTTSSSIRTNGVQAVSGNSGTQAPGRFTVGSDYPLDAFTGNVYLSELLIYRTNLTLVQVTNVENYFRVKYGAW